jgi:hypothetical protein
MSFLFPSFLYALTAIGVPILIHLFNFRRYKKIYFSNVRFLKEVVQESRSRSRLKHWLVLLCRILIVTFLVLAFAQPYTPLKQGYAGSGSKAVSIFIDNSFSMNAVNQNGTLLEDAKTKATQIAQSLNASDKVQLVSEDFDEGQERWLNKDEFIEELKGLKISPDSRSLTEIMKRQNENLQHSGNAVKEAFVISDFQKSFSSLSNYAPASNVSTDMVPVVAEARNNISVDSCWFNSPLHLPGKAEELNVRLTNYSTASVKDAPIKLFINGEEKAMSSFNIDPAAQVTIKLSFIPSAKTIQQGEIKINDYPINFDDQLFFSFKLSSHIPVLWIHPDSISKNNYLASLYGKDSLFTFKSAVSTHLDYSSLPSYRLIILDNLSSVESGMGHELNSYLKQGGNVMVIPPASGINMDSYREFLSSVNASWFERLDTTHLKVDKLNFESTIYSGVFERKAHPNMDLPLVSRHYVISTAGKTLSENLMKLENGNDFLDEFHYEKGNLYLLAVSLNDAFSNFQKHAIFVPTLYNIGLYSLPNQALYYSMGDMQPIEAPNVSLPQNKFFKVQASKDTLSIIPERRVVNNSVLLFMHNQVNVAGNFNLMAGDSLISGLSFNYNRKESDMSFLATTDLQAMCEATGLKNFTVLPVTTASVSALVQEVNRGKYYWKYCIILALLFLAAEEAILKLWKE